MAHKHHHPDPQKGNNAATVVSVVFVTAKNTFPASVPVQWVTPNIPSKPNPTQAPKNEDSDKGKTLVTGKPKQTQGPHSGDILATGAHSSATKLNVASGAASTSTSAPSANSQGASAGISGGAKAGLILGALVLVGALLAFILLMYKKKKDKQKGERIVDDEKAAYSKPANNEFYGVPAVREPSIRTGNTGSTAPRLSLRPVTQFSPILDSPKTIGSSTQIGSPAMLSPNVSRDNLATPNSQPPPSPWERRGAANAQSHSNPFGDHAATGNGPALASPSVPSGPADSRGMGMAPIPQQLPSLTHGSAAAAAALPKPLHIRADGSVGPPLASPAGSTWTEDIPASPGPAPAGAPPLVGGGPGPGPGPGPNNVHRVQMDFAPSMDDELEIHAGQLVRMLHEYDDGWALCVRLDRSHQGVVPRTCLSKYPVKPRAGPPRGPPPHARGPMGPGVPRPLTPNGRNSPGPGGFPSVPRGHPQNGRNSPGPYANQPPQGQPMYPPNQPMYQPSRPRSNSNAPAYGRSMSPGPYGHPDQMAPPDLRGRRRSNSASQILGMRNPPPGPSPLTTFTGTVTRKPVPGQAM